MAEQQMSFARWVLGLVLPLVFMGLTASYFYLACLLNPHLLLTRKIDQIRDKAFALFWSRFGPMIANDFPSPQLGDIVTEQCSGMVLDIGPGAGFQLKRFAGAWSKGQIKRIYGVEPGIDMHKQLRLEAASVFGPEVSSRFAILTTGAQPDELVPALAKEGLLAQQGDGVFDTIITFRALCGIPDPQKTVDLFYRLLKPGGRLIFLEHVSNSGDASKGGSLLAWALQRVYMRMGWKFWNGGCELTRDTEQFMNIAARQGFGWSVKEVYRTKTQGCIPEIYGYMQKE